MSCVVRIIFDTLDDDVYAPYFSDDEVSCMDLDQLIYLFTSAQSYSSN